jgi:putative membrane-bound dehydrogenase-like protein
MSSDKWEVTPGLFLGRLLLSFLIIGWAATARADGPVPPSEAASKMTVPDGFKVTLFAAEPDVRQPIAFTIDARGRLWVAENYSYPNWRTKPDGKDRIVIFEDTDGDGHFDRRKVFWEKGANLTGLTLGFGGVWACETPNLIFIPDADGDDVPDGDPVVKLDGWDVKAQHNMFNALNWGPDGWLYGCNGIMSNSKVGKPGTPDVDRVPINCGVWRYHPTRQVFEAVAHGTTNPWGLDFDDHGQAFITNCVIPHLYRVVPGARFQRMYGQDFNRFTYELMPTTADHIHWAGGSWTDSRGGQGKHGEAGGGHAHVGAMVYLGDNWPAEYRDTLFTCNLHGNRVNNDSLVRESSGYVAKHKPDFLMANDPWFRGMEMKSGPDGGVFLTDWSDTGECHETDADGPHRENGRIYKITYGTPKPVVVDLAKLSSVELAKLQSHPNEWHVRTARRLLQERASRGEDMAEVHRVLKSQYAENSGVPRRLRMIWALYVTNGLGESDLVDLATSRPEEWFRAWAVRLMADSGEPTARAKTTFEKLAGDDTPLVRLEVASALRRIPTDDPKNPFSGLSPRDSIESALLSGLKNEDDLSLTLMIWYDVEPMVSLNRDWAVSKVEFCRSSRIRQFLTRRIIAVDDELGDHKGAWDLIAKYAIVDYHHGIRSVSPDVQLDVLSGIREAYRGRKKVAMPTSWPTDIKEAMASEMTPEVRNVVLALALQFGDPKAVALLEETASSFVQPMERRIDAIRLLSERQVPGLASRLLPLIDQPSLRGAAIRGLAGYDEPAIPSAIVRAYPRLNESEKGEAVATLSSRSSYAMALLEAVRSGAIPRRDLSVTIARQLQSMSDPKVKATLAEVWGTIRPTSGEKAPLMAKYKAILAPDRLKAADLSKGRSVFQRNCVSCHKLFDEGANLGPELTGSDRANLDYVLENVLDPSASVPAEYRVSTLATTDGRVLSGMIQQQDDKTVVVRTTNDRVVLAREDVAELKASNQSMMPEGLFERLTDEEVRDLVAYLASKVQVPAALSHP